MSTDAIRELEREPEQPFSTEACAALAAADDAAIAAADRPWIPKSNAISFIGHPCERFIWYMRTRAQDVKRSDVRRLKTFWMGRTLEAPTIERVDAAARRLGWRLLTLPRQSNRFQVGNGISGSLDCILDRQRGAPIVCEIKWVVEHAFEAVDSVDDMRARSEPWWRGYDAQLLGYETAAEAYGWAGRDGFWAVGGKTSGRIKFIPCPWDQDRWDSVNARAGRIETRLDALARARGAATAGDFDLSLDPSADRSPTGTPEIQGPGYEPLFRKALETFHVEHSTPRETEVAAIEAIAPDRIGADPCCGYCEFAPICLTERSGGQAGGVIEDPELQQKIARVLETDPVASEHDRLEKQVREQILKLTDPDFDAVWLAPAGSVTVKRYETTIYDVPADLKAKYAGKKTATRIKIAGSGE